jgi:hypothetical protein
MNLRRRTALAIGGFVLGLATFTAPAARAQQSDAIAMTLETQSQSGSSSSNTSSNTTTQQSGTNSSDSSQTQTPQNTPNHVQPGQTAKPQSIQEKNGGSNERILWIYPNFFSVDEDKYNGPITAGQKFRLVTRSSFDPGEFLWYGFLAGISQAQNSEKAYGQGAEGYAKRYASQFGDGTIESYLVEFGFPVVFKQDPRYFRVGEGSFGYRTGRVIKRLVVTKGDNGKDQFNVSEVFGSGTAAVVSIYSYHPQDERNFSNVASVWGEQVAFDAAEMMFKEFWPDVRQKLRDKKAAKAAAQQP